MITTHESLNMSLAAVDQEHIVLAMGQSKRQCRLQFCKCQQDDTDESQGNGQ